VKLLLIEDDALLGQLHDYLAAEGHGVHWCRLLADARALRREPFDAWLVDRQLSDGNGLDWLRARRDEGQTTPAFVLTARDRLEDRVEGQDAGAEDHPVKPIAPEELAARLRPLGPRPACAALVKTERGLGDRLAIGT
jgi:two-component system OmpR family response regulator